MKFLIIKPENELYPISDPWAPLGIAYLSAFLEKNDIDVRIVDNRVMHLTDNQLIDIVNKYSPDIIGFSIYTLEAPTGYKLAKIIKQVSPNTKIVFGGVHATFMPKECLENSADFVVVGEGELTTLELIHSLSEGTEPRDVLGIAYKDDTKIRMTSPRPFIKDLDMLPFPARHLLPIDRYADKLINGTPAITIMTGRGCPFRCVFCSSPRLYKRRVRLRSIENVITEIKDCLEKFHISAMNIVDDTFTLSKKRVFAFCHELTKEKLDIEWSCLTRVDMVDIEVLRAMKKAGCYSITLGIESGSERILKLIKKDITPSQVRRAVKMAKEVGLKVEGDFMIGNIGETRDTILETLRLMQDLDFDAISYQLATPFPGTEFGDIADKYGRVLPKGYEHYKSDEVTFVPNGLTEEMLLNLDSYVTFDFYSHLSLRSLLAVHRIRTYFVRWIRKNPFHLLVMLLKLFKKKVSRERVT